MQTTDVDHRALAISINQRTWFLLEKKNRSVDESDEMIHAAHASLWHWLQAGGPIQQQRGEWLIGRVYVVLGLRDQALRAATRVLELTKIHSADLQDFDHAYAYELMARALELTGKSTEAVENWQIAMDLGEQIAVTSDRENFERDLRSIPFRPVSQVNSDE
ncbi:hypothetical protein [Roseibium album]|uniref:hypothetical protein n=1 Tax=Roseibium album TaxID=311410 RepID=UPI003BB0C5C7